jgi:hypothetical protein
MSGNEASAIGSLRAVSSAQSTFAASCANGLYASTLDILGSGPSGGSAFISPDLGAAATANKSGYIINMATETAVTTTTACNTKTALGSGYHAWADPFSTSSGTRFFFTNTTGTIWQAMATMTGVTTDVTAPTGGVPIQ